MSSYSDPAHGAIAVTPSNTVAIPGVPRSLYVGGGGDVSVLMSDGSSAVFSAVPAGTVLPIRVTRVNVTGTTATLMLALF